MPHTGALARRIVALTLVCVSVVIVAGCARDPGAPVDAAGNPLSPDDPDRFIPARISGSLLKPLAPFEQDKMQGRISEFGLDGWLAGATGALRTLEVDPAPVYEVVGDTKTVDPDLLPRLTFLISGPGEVQDVEKTQIDGQDVVKGKVLNSDGRFEFVAWQALPHRAVVLVSTKQSAATGYNADEAMSEVIRWSQS
ncbi:MAG: hypothetical protein K1X95_13095 [Acidimicrobiia bacterium]|nr:hypothetical protein [Acidimicrobiia bacterium]